MDQQESELEKQKKLDEKFTRLRLKRDGLDASVMVLRSRLLRWDRLVRENNRLLTTEKARLHGLKTEMDRCAALANTKLIQIQDSHDKMQALRADVHSVNSAIGQHEARLNHLLTSRDQCHDRQAHTAAHRRLLAQHIAAQQQKRSKASKDLDGAQSHLTLIKTELKALAARGKTPPSRSFKMMTTRHGQILRSIAELKKVMEKCDQELHQLDDIVKASEERHSKDAKTAAETQSIIPSLQMTINELKKNVNLKKKELKTQQRMHSSLIEHQRAAGSTLVPIRERFENIKTLYQALERKADLLERSKKDTVHRLYDCSSGSKAVKVQMKSIIRELAKLQPEDNDHAESKRRTHAVTMLSGGDTNPSIVCFIGQHQLFGDFSVTSFLIMFVAADSSFQVCVDFADVESLSMDRPSVAERDLLADLQNTFAVTGEDAAPETSSDFKGNSPGPGDTASSPRSGASDCRLLTINLKANFQNRLKPSDMKDAVSSAHWLTSTVSGSLNSWEDHKESEDARWLRINESLKSRPRLAILGPGSVLKEYSKTIAASLNKYKQTTEKMRRRGSSGASTHSYKNRTSSLDGDEYEQTPQAQPLDTSHDSASGDELDVCRFEGESNILPHQAISELLQEVPQRLKLFVWHRCYSLIEDGANLNRFFTSQRKANACLLIIKDSNGVAFGVFCVPAFDKRQMGAYYGEGECFVYRFHSEHKSAGRQLEVFLSTGVNAWHMLTNKDSISIGGGNAFAITIDNSLRKGNSYASVTYDNPVLASAEEWDCYDLEVWIPGDIVTF